MRVLVTGGTGFIGSHLVEALVAAGHETSCAIRNPQEAEGRIPRQAQVIPLEQILAGQSPFPRADALLHLAAIRHRWGASEEEYFSANVGLTERLLELSAGRIAQFIYCSSIAVFGWPRRGPIDESFPYGPLNAYGKSKVHCERMVLKWGRSRKINTTIIRPSITYGRRDATGMLTKLAGMLDRGIYFTVGNGENRVQLAHVEDIVQGLLLPLGNSKAFGRAYIITAQTPITINRLVELVAKALGKPSPRWKIPRPIACLVALVLESCYAAGWHVTGWEPIIAREKIQVMTTDRHYSIARAQDELGYKPRYDYSTGIDHFIQGLRQDSFLHPGEA
jgi:nucleoside-diphosphate-sugar epimerase